MKLRQFALPVSDPDVSEKFYRDLLGLTELFRFGDLVFFNCDGIRLMLEKSGSPVEPGDSVCHYFSVNDIEEAAARFSAMGVRFEDKPHLITTMRDHELWMTFFKDPDGHMLALMEERRLAGQPSSS